MDVSVQHLPQWKQLQHLTKMVSIEVSARGVQDEAAKLKKALHAAYPRESIELDRTIPNKMVSFRFAKTTRRKNGRNAKTAFIHAVFMSFSR